MPPSTFDAKTTAVEAAETFSSQIKGKVVLVTGGKKNISRFRFVLYNKLTAAFR